MFVDFLLLYVTHLIHWALSTLDPNLCIEIGGVRLSHLAFADDIGLLTRTSVGAQSQINRLNDHLKKCGLLAQASLVSQRL